MIEEKKKCLECEKELVKPKRKYCSTKCKDKYRYHNDEYNRLKRINRAKIRECDKRELVRVKKEKDVIRQMLGDLSKEKTKEELEIEILFNLIKNK